MRLVVPRPLAVLGVPGQLLSELGCQPGPVLFKHQFGVIAQRPLKRQLGLPWSAFSSSTVLPRTAGMPDSGMPSTFAQCLKQHPFDHPQFHNPQNRRCLDEMDVALSKLASRNMSLQ